MNVIVLSTWIVLYYSIYSVEAISNYSFRSSQGIIPYNVSFNNRGILINHQPVLLECGEIEYSRLSAGMWTNTLTSYYSSGLNCIQTSFYWSHHEMSKQVFDWTSDNRNLGLFLQTAADAGLFVHFRVGPYINHQNSYGGIPFRLREEEGIKFRSNNTIWLDEVKLMLKYLMSYIEPYLARNGGPIIMIGLEEDLQLISEESGYDEYLLELIDIASTQLNVGLPVVLSNVGNNISVDDPFILFSFNGIYTTEFIQSHRAAYPNQMLLTTSLILTPSNTYLSPQSYRPIEDVTYAAVQFIAQGGSYLNWFSFSSGSRFGRSGGSNAEDNLPYTNTLSFYNSPLDPLGFPTQSYYHLSKLNNIITYYAETLLALPIALSQNTSDMNLNAFLYKSNSSNSILFLICSSTSDCRGEYLNRTYTVPAWSSSIFDYDSQPPVLLFNTANVEIIPQPSTQMVMKVNKDWIFYVTEPIGIWNYSLSTKSQAPIEQLQLTHNNNDYCWYSTTINITQSIIDKKVVQLSVLANSLLLIYVNSTYITKSLATSRAQVLISIDVSSYKIGFYTLDILSISQSLPSFERRPELHEEGIIGPVYFDILNLTSSLWIQLPSLYGYFQDYTNPLNPSNTTWKNWNSQLSNHSLVWYNISIETPLVNTSHSNGLYLNMSKMGRGHIWWNGIDLGLYWATINNQSTSNCTDICHYAGYWNRNKCLINCSESSQSLYVIPPDYINPTGQNNSLVIIEEIGGDPSSINIIADYGVTKTHTSNRIANM